MPGDEAFSNPLAPPDNRQYQKPEAETKKSRQQQALTNDDFRKLLTTPRVGGGGGELRLPSGGPGFAHHKSSGAQLDIGKKNAAKPQKKKKNYTKNKNEEEDELNEILKNYRDRATERRQGETKEQAAEIELIRAQGGYKAVGHDSRSTLDAAERRKQLIQESKYLGGDMEHTHLVKGLDYALLQKVRSEITSKEQEEEELEKIYHQKKTEREEVEANMKSALAKNIYRVLFKDEPPKVNELFAPRRMAYSIDLDEDTIESEIPTTVVRSKQDCPADEATTNLSTNDMVIQKLTQVLSYLRTDTKRKKKEKGTETKLEETQRAKVASQGIYEDAGDYVPNVNVSSKKDKNKPYFDNHDDDAKEAFRKEEREGGGKGRGGERKHRREEGGGRRKEREEKNIDPRLAEGWAPADLSLQKQQQLGHNPNSLTKEEKDKGMGSVLKRDHDPFRKAEPTKSGLKMSAIDLDSYAECYPGYKEAYDAAGDSDEDADFTKMDMGNRKGPIKRWDFDNEDDYEQYMSSKEAMPKAAFQYGVKMNDGRKTRKSGMGEKDQKQKIDKEWQKISKILDKRKPTGDEGSSSTKKSKV